MTQIIRDDDFQDLQDGDSHWTTPRKGAAMVSTTNIFNDGTLNTRNLLLRGVAAVYLMAFIGFYHQSPGNW